MSTLMFQSVLIDQPDVGDENPNWLWHGYLAPGNVTLLTSPWKAGKTTLLTGLLRQLGTGDAFLERPCRPAKAMVVSEESPRHWSDRLKDRPIGPHTRLITRPFARRPTLTDWESLIDHAAKLREQRELDLLVIDPLASCLPGGSESAASRMLEVLQPLHRLTGLGAAVLLLHHPRKARSGRATRHAAAGRCSASWT